MGNPVAVLSNQRKYKLEPRGNFGRLIGLNAELKSYRVKLDDGKIVNSKSVKFLDFDTKDSVMPDYGELIFQEKPQSLDKPPQNLRETENSADIGESVKEEDKEPKFSGSFHSAEEDSTEDKTDVADLLIPNPEEPVRRVLQERTLQVKPVKYSHFSEDPTTFRQAIHSENGTRWREAINTEIDCIEDHDVWVDQYEEPAKHFNSTWVFRTKPATASSPKKIKARLCIQGFMQNFGEDFFETFAPTGKFPSLLALLVLAINLKLPIKQFDVKSAFLFAPLEEEIYIKTPEGSKRTAPYLRLVKSLHGL